MTVTKKRMTLDGYFLEADIYVHPNGGFRLEVMYLEPPQPRVLVLAEEYPPQDLVDVMVRDTGNLIARARALTPAISAREASSVAATRDLELEERDVYCEHCLAKPGVPCRDGDEGCQEARADWLMRFRLWLTETDHPEDHPDIAIGMTKNRIRELVERMGYDVKNPYDRGTQIVIERAATGELWGLYVGGRMDGTRSVWMTSGADMSDPEHGPFRNEREIAGGLRAWGRGK